MEFFPTPHPRVVISSEFISSRARALSNLLEIRTVQMFPRPYKIQRDYLEGEKDILLWQ